MAKTLLQLKEQIAQLEKEAAALRTKESAGVIASIKDAIATYGITAADLFGGGAVRTATVKSAKPVAVGKKAVAAGAKKSASPVKFRNSDGRTWSGHGKRPDWYKAAIASGKTPEDLLAK